MRAAPKINMESVASGAAASDGQSDTLELQSGQSKALSEDPQPIHYSEELGPAPK